MWAGASLVYFIYIAVVALVRRGLRRGARARACAGAAAGLLLAFAGTHATSFWLSLVLLPPTALLVAYWSSGFLWVKPMPRIECLLLASDRALRVPQIAARLPHVVATLLEVSYVGIYALVPIGLGLHLAFAPTPDADRFWAVILVTDFICFGMLPWVQTRPPRTLESSAPWSSPVRALNVRLLRETSIGVNTVPSGHAAEALAVALLLSGAIWPVEVAMWMAAVAVTAGAVFGRYHFAIDAIAGWAVALAVWLLMRPT